MVKLHVQAAAEQRRQGRGTGSGTMRASSLLYNFFLNETAQLQVAVTLLWSSAAVGLVHCEAKTVPQSSRHRMNTSGVAEIVIFLATTFVDKMNVQYRTYCAVAVI